jgi:hypothetical protein
MNCPHCLTKFFPNWDYRNFSQIADPDDKKHWMIRYCECPECHRTVVQSGTSLLSVNHVRDFILVYPKGVSRAPLDPDVPDKYAGDYRESCLVLADSPKASAALSRRCLQNILRDEAHTVKKDLNDQIQEVLDVNKFPSYLSEGLDAVRVIGNFAAHPIKSKSTGEIVEVEPGEAEWNLDVVEGLFDFFFVQPKVLKEKREKLNKKLEDAGKPPLR